MNEQLKTTQTKEKKTQGRSPSYPAIDLEKAIERAKTMWEREHRNTAPPETVLKHWGYAAKSSMGLVTLAALKKFGLLDDEGSGAKRRVKLSELAFKILLDDRENSPERNQAIKEAALTPKIHKKLWSECGENLPSDENLRYRLRIEEHFTDSATNEFIKQFRDTIRFANLTSSDIISGQEEDKQLPPKEKPMTSMPQGQIFKGNGEISLQKLQIPILFSPKKMGLIEVPKPLSEEEWGRMITILEAYKPSLIEEKDLKEKDEKKVEPENV